MKYIFLCFNFYLVSSIQIRTDDCGKAKGCWLEPRNCEQDGSTEWCDYVLTWRPEADGLAMEMATNISFINDTFSAYYVSAAFSHDQFMGEDTVVECVSSQDGRVNTFISFNDGSHNHRLYQASQTMIKPYDFSENPTDTSIMGSVVDGQLRCHFILLYQPPLDDESPDYSMVSDARMYDWQMLLVKGKAHPLSHELYMHSLYDGDLYPWVATHKVNVTNVDNMQNVSYSKHYVNDIPRSQQYQMVSAHGIMMIFAWWLLASVAMMVARHFRKSFSAKKILGTTLWFQLHRNLLVISVTLQMIAFGLIFIQCGEWLGFCTRECGFEDYALVLHTILGLTCSAAALIQPFMAWARPKQTHQYRFLFNTAHWIIGNGAFVLATITIFLSIPLGKSGLYREKGRIPQGIMGLYVAVYIITSIALELVSMLAKKHKMANMRLNDPFGVLGGPNAVAKAGQYNNPSYTTVPSNGADGSRGAKTFTKAEVRRHSSSGSCWIILHDRVYDVTKFLEDHPGGAEPILDYAGLDGTNAFEDFNHSEYARTLRENYFVGELVPEERRQNAPASNSRNSGDADSTSFAEKLKLIIFGVYILTTIALCIALAVLIGTVH